MKKTLMIFAAFTVLVAFASCSKDYTCECVTNVSGTDVTTPHEMKGKKKDVEAACEALDAAVSTTCKLQ